MLQWQVLLPRRLMLRCQLHLQGLRLVAMVQIQQTLECLPLPPPPLLTLPLLPLPPLPPQQSHLAAVLRVQVVQLLLQTFQHTLTPLEMTATGYLLQMTMSCRRRPWEPTTQQVTHQQRPRTRVLGGCHLELQALEACLEIMRDLACLMHPSVTVMQYWSIKGNRRHQTKKLCPAHGSARRANTTK